MDVMNCQDLAVPIAVMRHVVDVESAFNRYAIGVVGGRLLRQPRSLPEAVATARMLESRGYNFSIGLAQVNRYNLAKYGLASYTTAFQACPNLQAGARILADCHARSGDDWGKSLSCYYSGNFVTGFRDGYVQKVFASMRAAAGAGEGVPYGAIPVVANQVHRDGSSRAMPAAGVLPLLERRMSSPVVATAIGASGPTAADSPSLQPAATNQASVGVVVPPASAVGQIDAAFVF